MSENGYHLRVRATEQGKEKQQLADILDLYIEKYQPKVYIAGYEEVIEDGKSNKHMHVHIEYNGEAPKKQTISDFFKKHKLTGKYYHQQIKTTNEQNKLYITKDLDLIKYNVTEEEINRITEATQVINKSKKQDARKKILEAYSKYIIEADQLIAKLDELQQSKVASDYCRFAHIAMFIHKLYVNEYDKEPPTYKMKGYILYVAEKVNQMKELQFISYDIENYYYNFMGIGA